jgi:hypothetical protein
MGIQGTHPAVGDPWLARRRLAWLPWVCSTLVGFFLVNAVMLLGKAEPRNVSIFNLLVGVL